MIESLDFKGKGVALKHPLFFETIDKSKRKIFLKLGMENMKGII